MWNLPSTSSRPRLRRSLIATVVLALGMLAPSAAAGHRGPSKPPSKPANRVVAKARATSPLTCSKVASPGQGTAQALLASLAPGQVGCLRGGTYTATGSYVLDFSNRDVTITSYPDERALLVGVMVFRNGASGSKLTRVAVEGTGGPTGKSNTIQILGAADVVIQDSD